MGPTQSPEVNHTSQEKTMRLHLLKRALTGPTVKIALKPFLKKTPFIPRLLIRWSNIWYPTVSNTFLMSKKIDIGTLPDINAQLTVQTRCCKGRSRGMTFTKPKLCLTQKPIHLKEIIEPFKFTTFSSICEKMGKIEYGSTVFYIWLATTILK